MTSDQPLRRSLDRRLFAVVLCWALVASAGCFGAIQAADRYNGANQQSRQALGRAIQADQQATKALGQDAVSLQRANTALSSLAIEARALCSATASTNVYVNRAHLVIFHVLQEAAHLQVRQATLLSPTQSRHVARKLARDFAISAGAVQLLPPPDCVALTTHPQTYQLPVPYHPGR